MISKVALQSVIRSLPAKVKPVYCVLQMWRLLDGQRATDEWVDGLDGSYMVQVIGWQVIPICPCIQRFIGALLLNRLRVSSSLLPLALLRLLWTRNYQVKL